MNIKLTRISLPVFFVGLGVVIVLASEAFSQAKSEKLSPTRRRKARSKFGDRLGRSSGKTSSRRLARRCQKSTRMAGYPLRIAIRQAPNREARRPL